MLLFILLEDFSPKATLSTSQLQLQLLWTELGPSMASPNISVLPSILGAGDSGKGGHKKSLPSCVRRKTPKGMQRCLQGPGHGAGTFPHLSLLGTESLEHYRDWKERKKNKKKKEILVVLVSNRKWNGFFPEVFHSM